MGTTQTSAAIQEVRRSVVLRDHTAMTDGGLLEAFVAGGDAAALEALIKRHGPMVWGVCRRALHSRQDAEDAYQATFLVLVRRAASILPRETVASWLYGVARRTALKAKASAARRRLREQPGASAPEPAAVAPAPRGELASTIDRELSRLPDRYRVAVVLCDLEGLTRRDAARRLALPEGTVASRLARGRALLAKRLIRLGLPAAGGASVAGLTADVAAFPPAAAVVAAARAAPQAAAGQLPNQLIPAQATALAERVLWSMLVSRASGTLARLSALAVTLAGLCFVAGDGMAGQPTTTGKPAPARPDAARPAPNRKDGPIASNADARYCRLVFGPKAAVRALVRIDGGKVAIDRDGDGKFDSPGERFASWKDCKGVVIPDPDGKTSYEITSLEDMHVVPPEVFIAVGVLVRGPVQYPQTGIVQLADRPADAPEMHFHGPLTVTPKGWRIANRATHLLENDLVNLSALVPGPIKRLAGKGLVEETSLPRSFARPGPTRLLAVISTEGKRNVVSVSALPGDRQKRTSPFPKGVHPVADVEFPAREPGKPAVRKRYPLDESFLDGMFFGSVRVPNEAGSGTARVTFSFDSWKAVHVAPSTFEVRVEGPAAGATDR